MDDYYSGNYGDRVASVYDQWYPSSTTDSACVEALAILTGNGSALELGVGTGRIAIPLAQKGCKVSAIDNSEKMLDKLRAKPGADKLSIFVGDFVDLPIEGSFDLIYSLQSFYYLFDQADQIRCFCNVSRKLTEHGVFVIETWMPPRTLASEWSYWFGVAEADSAGICFSRADVAHQIVELQLAQLRNSVPMLIQERVRYVWPTELDLLARIAGMTPSHRWGNWKKEEFTPESRAHIGVYRRVAV